MRISRFLILLGCTWLPAHAVDHWAYTPPREVIPQEANHPVDALLDAARRQAGIRPARLAPPRRWVERAAFTLTGLPASPEQLDRIERRPDDATWRAIIDEMLASPAYGERWARHWMDVARYADTRGYHFDRDNRYPFAYTYRDWLIRAFNEDLPYWDFVKLQIAADLLTDREDHPDLAALGFLTVGPRAGRVETLDDRVDVITRGFLSSTVSCARCHDHKTDPISTQDYYSIYSILDNTHEPENRPIIGTPPSEQEHQSYLAELAKLENEDREARQKMVDELRSPEVIANYIGLAWRAKKENWDQGAAAAEGFKLGRYRAQAIIRWRDFLNETAWKENGTPRLVRWAAEMEAAASDESARSSLCTTLAQEWAASADDDELKVAFARDNCPVSYGIDRIQQIFDTQDSQGNAARESAMSRLQTEHPGSPPRAMAIRDKGEFAPARIFRRGNPSEPGEPFEREWLSFLGGGPFEEGKSPRLALAEKIADPENPLTARVIVNRVWGWHFGEALTEPGDFGPQQVEPPLRPLIDWLARRFIEDGASLKELHRLMLSSRAFRLASDGPDANLAKDEGNAYYWKWNRRRADFESMRDRLLATAGSLDTSATGGRSIKLDAPSADARRSLYAFVDRYELPGTFVSFDLPHPDHHAPKRVETTVPQQALFFLNSPLLLRQAAKLATHPEFRKLPDDSARLVWIYQRLFHRAPHPEESRLALEWLAAADPADYLPRLGGHWEVRHAPDMDGQIGEALPFPIFHENSWRTGEELSSAPIPWLHAAAGHGHASAGHALILRWRATGAGTVRMTGSAERTQKTGDTLEWIVAGADRRPLASATLPPEAKTSIESEWITVAPGDTLDFILRAPAGHNSASVRWELKVIGREEKDSKPAVVGHFNREFPTSDSARSAQPPADPWADLIQMLWASNEFHYID
jgi:hypothetical protein